MIRKMPEKDTLVRWVQSIIFANAWIFVVCVVGFVGYFVWLNIDVSGVQWSKYVNVAMSAKLINLVLLYGSIVLFDAINFAHRNTMHEVLDKPEQAVKIYVSLILATGYVLGLT